MKRGTSSGTPKTGTGAKTGARATNRGTKAALERTSKGSPAEDVPKARNRVKPDPSGVQVRKGEHVALLHTEPAVLNEALGWLGEGLHSGESVALLAYDGLRARASAQLRDLHGVNVREALAAGTLVLMHGNESPKEVLQEISRFAGKRGEGARRGKRLLVSLGWGDAGWPDEDAGIELDSKLNDLCAQHGVAVMCLYDARQLGGGTVLGGALECHPTVICRGHSRKNPFFIQPALVQKELRTRRVDDDRLAAWLL